ncbi:neuraminidase-like domain-containing protein [Morganella morganii]|uniref:Tc toxin subunit A-related protein n=1 Tax=Morganella morganii TaxID=582 RepID=UPI00069A987E|nr:neuraminidase-like domain-containing protein [Morganella morganii]KNZ86236.1 insecticidal toxin protein [Morganella morganii]MDF2404553.1 insecticidal toxin protein [Morganella morganii]HCR4032788.1 insecticidal toxin protein [Morganella morganii]
MEKITRVLEKLNQGRTDQPLTLADFMPLSLAEIRNTRQLSRDEARLLFRAAQKEKQNNLLYTARALTRANPLLRNEMGRARYHGATPYGYDDIIVPRADEFAAPGAVSSMFSPAGYLTELYREARGLHPKDSDHNLDKRRPDLAKLVLSQDNLDNEISALSLANEQLETALMTQAGQTDKSTYYETLAKSCNSGVTPYNLPFEGMHNALAQRNFVLPDNILSTPAKFAILAAYDAGISPKLYAILKEETESLTGSDLKKSLKNNFPMIKIKDLMTLDALANYYELPADEIQALIAAEITGLLSTPDMYDDDYKLVIPAISTGGKIRFSELAKTPDDKKQAIYIDLIPQGGNQFLVNFSVTETLKDATHFSIGYNESFNNLADKKGFVPLAGEHYSIPVTLDAKLLEAKTKIGITRKKPEPASDGNYYTSTTFTIRPDAKPGTWLLRLNKTLRLAKVSGMTPRETQHALIHVRNDSGEYELRRFTETLLYRKRYSIDTETALMLCNAGISKIRYNGQLSHFDRLFNNPPLNGVTYTLGGDDIPMEPDAKDPRREVLKRAFRVDNTGLWQLFVITNRENKSKTIENKTEKLRGLLFVRLLADVHNLTVTQLDALLRISPYSSMDVYNLDGKVRQKMLSFLSRITQWLNTQNITAEQLMLLLSKESPAVPTKEMQVLLDLLRNGGIDKTDTELYTTMAPVITAAMQLDVTESGEALLRWLDNNHPAEIPTTTEARELIIKKEQTADDKKKLAAWCQALAQRALVIRTFALSNAELQTLSQGAAAGTITDLYNICDFHNLINRCGEQAGTVLDALQRKTLTVNILAQALNLSEDVITQALTQAGQKPELTTWPQLAILPPRLDLADTLHITPKDITTLLTVSENVKASYADLSALTGLLQAGLNEQQTRQLQNQSEPRRNEALSGEYRSLVMNNPVANRDDIWRNLLLDGKVSADITTTLLADAIAGIQLYINRTIAGDEPGADSDALERQFFKDWDACNKRYSTWAGVSQLVYYPENFVDPTLRIGQTGMMNTMLEQLSQSELSKDTLENGFRQYLTAFEQVANLKVVSGYHDAVNIEQGNTWFIGTSQTEPKKYYWRKADHSKCQNGRFAANAWSDWKEITCAVNPYGDMVRPVIFHSRLYLLWIEKQVQKDNTGKDTASFTLKLTHIKYDGSWVSPFSYHVTDDFITGGEKNGLYCAANQEDNSLLIACYKKITNNNTVPDGTFGFNILPDMSQEKEEDIKNILNKVFYQLDTETTVRVNTLLNSKFAYEFTLGSQDGNPALNLTLSPGNYFIRNDDDKKTLILNPDAYITIDPGKTFDYIPEPLRRRYISIVNITGATIYKPESMEIKPIDNKMSGSINKLAVVGIKPKDSASEMALSICNLKPVVDDIILTSNTTQRSFTLGKNEKSGSCFIYNGILQYELATNSENYAIQTDAPNTGTLLLGAMKAQAKPIHENNIEITFKLKESELKKISGHDAGITPPTYPLNSEKILEFPFGEQKIALPDNTDINDLEITVTVSFKNTDVLAATATYKLVIKNAVLDPRSISLYTTPEGAQYMEWDGYRTRLNTLFTRQLIERANNGIDAILSPETQYLPEPKPGQGTYVTLTLNPYNPDIHGTDRAFTIYYSNVVTDSGKFSVYSGSLSITDTTEVKLFIPLIKNAAGQSADTQQDTLYLNAKYQKEATKPICLHRTDADKNNPEGWTLDKSVNKGTFAGLAEDGVSGLLQSGEPMDFSGANALYFWELFYYTPMMVATRLLQEQNFTDANRWLSYIWRPDANGAGDWRVRPLKEDTSWNADPLDSVDPDAVAQNDPMHYKVSTLMKLLDLLISRGDKAYRMLERDTLNEAKMWYMQALGLLGDKPVSILSNGWENPSLSNAADKTQTKQFHDEISRIRSGGLLPDVRTANTLTGLFRPQQNEKLLGYWQTLEMRLFNLRNNLSIDGQPLSLPIFAAPADPAALLSAAAAASGGSKSLPSADIPAMRFPQALESARSLTGQLMQFGSTLQGLIERRDAGAMSELLQNQAGELILSSLRMQEQALTELDAEKKTLEQGRAGAQSRVDSYRVLYDENVSAEEKRTMDLYLSSSVLSSSIEALDMASAVADMVPNVFGMATGGSRWGGIPKAIGAGISLAVSATHITADNISQSEAWRRRRQEWEIQKNNAESEVKQIDAQLEALAVRRTATEMQYKHLELQQVQTQTQLELMQRQFSNKALYSWLNGRLASIYYRFYDLTAASCMMAEKAYAWHTNDTTRYIKSGAWQSNNAGLMAGESLLLNLAEMEQAWLKWNSRSLEVTRTVSLAEVYRTDNIILAEKIADLLKGSGSGDTPASTGLSMTEDKQLHAAFNLKALNIAQDYPFKEKKTRRIKQISVTLPALIGPYQDMRAIFSYGGSSLPAGCRAIALSHGINDDGQFLLDFNDGYWLPFEGIPVDDNNSLTLSFPDAIGEKQKPLLLSLTDIIIHIRYTIC